MKPIAKQEAPPRQWFRNVCLLTLTCLLAYPSAQAQTAAEAPEKTLININDIQEDRDSWKSYLTWSLLQNTLFVMVELVSIEIVEPITLEKPYEKVELSVRILESYSGDAAPGTIVTYYEYSEDNQAYHPLHWEEPAIMGLCQLKDGSYIREGGDFYIWQEIKDHARAVESMYPNHRISTFCR